MKIRLSQLFFVLSQPKLSVHLKILFSIMFFKEAIVILSSMYCFGEIHLSIYLRTWVESVLYLVFIVWTPPSLPPPPLPPEGEIRKIKKGGRSMVQGQVFLKGGGWHFSDLIFSRFMFLHLEITLPFAKLCHAFEEKLFFSATIILWKKVILRYLKMNLDISHKLR